PTLRAPARLHRDACAVQGAARLGCGAGRTAAGGESRCRSAPRHPAPRPAQFGLRVRQPQGGFRGPPDRAGRAEGDYARRGADQRTPRELHRKSRRRDGGQRRRVDRAGARYRAGEGRRGAEARGAARRRLRPAAPGGAGTSPSPAGGSRFREVPAGGATMTFKALQMAQVRRAAAELDRAAWRSMFGALLRTVAAAAVSGALSFVGWQVWQWATASDAFALRTVHFSGLVHQREPDLYTPAGLRIGENRLLADLSPAARATPAPCRRSASARATSR